MPRPNSLTKAMACLFKYIGNRAGLARVLSYWGHIETAHIGAHTQEKNSMTSAPTNNHAQIRFCTLWVCKQQDYAMHTC